MAINLSTKRMQIDKANLSMVIIVAVAASITMFSLVACKALLSQRSYQSRVITKKEIAKKQLENNVTEANKLVKSYEDFVSKPVNIIGGSSNGAGDRDGDNAKIILDALPSKYDFPALAVSMDKLFSDSHFKSSGFAGTDDEIAQSAVAASSSPQKVEIPFTANVPTDYGQLPALFGIFERNIRPMKIHTVAISGKDAQLNVSVTGVTYYQPQKSFAITKQVMK